VFSLRGCKEQNRIPCQRQMWLWYKSGGDRPQVEQRPTFGDCLRELGRLIQQDHDPTCVAAAQTLQPAKKDAADTSTKRTHDEGVSSLNTNQVLMLHIRLKIIQARAAQANKAALEGEKQRDELHTQIEEIEEQLQPKRTQTGHFWICKLGTFGGSMTCIERKFELQSRK
jgi:hypothetical protein